MGLAKRGELRFRFASPLTFHYLFRRQDTNRHCQMSKTAFSICLCSHLSLSFQKKGGGSAEANVENCIFHLPLLSPFTIFPEERRRLGRGKCRKLHFPFASALTFHYLCKEMQNKVADVCRHGVRQESHHRILPVKQIYEKIHSRFSNSRKCTVA